MQVTEIIQNCLDALGGGTYLEIGVGGGSVFNVIRAKRKLGVDPRPAISLSERIKKRIDNLSSPNKEIIFKMTSNKFFLKKPKLFKKDKITVVFIDGLHTYQQSLKDVFNSLKYLSEEGVVIMHDCNPQSKTVAHPALSFEHAISLKLPNWSGNWTGDVWKTITYLRSCREDLNVFVLDCNYGIGVITKGRPESMISCSVGDIEGMPYDNLDSHRKEFLNLKNPSYLYGFIKYLNKKNKDTLPSLSNPFSI